MMLRGLPRIDSSAAAEEVRRSGEVRPAGRRPVRVRVRDDAALLAVPPVSLRRTGEPAARKTHLCAAVIVRYGRGRRYAGLRAVRLA
jgi:hypothetical protein